MTLTRGLVLSVALVTSAGMRTFELRTSNFELRTSEFKIAPQSQTGWQAQGLASFDETWQTVADTFYDPSFGGLDWPAVRAELRPRVATAASPDDIRRLITEMLARLKRSHFVLLSASSADADVGPMGAATVPIELRVTPDGVVITSVEPGSAAAKAGLSPGQIIRAIDGTAATEWRSAGRTIEERHQRITFWGRADRALHGEVGSTVTLDVRLTGGDSRRITTTRVIASTPTVTLGNLPPLAVRTDVRELTSPAGHKIGLIGFNVWMTTIDAPVAAAVDRFRGADGLIFDLRGNPGGLAGMMSGISGQFMADADALLGRMQTREMQLEFHPNPRLSTTDGRRVQPFAGPVAVLVDELTGSTSECFTGGLQGLGRVRVFGRRTMGQALPALTKRLPNGDVLMYAVGTFVTGSGRSLEGDGVAPDDEVALSVAALAAGRDEVVEHAVRWFDVRAKRPAKPLQQR